MDAAKLLDELKASALPEFKYLVRQRGGGFLPELAAQYDLRRDVPELVDEYRERMNDRKDDYAGHANGFILKECGMAAYAVFSLVVAQGKPISGLRPAERDKAEAALAKALNALSLFKKRFRKVLAERHRERFFGKQSAA